MAKSFEECELTRDKLKTVNDELTKKFNEISKAHRDLRERFISTGISTVFINPSFRIEYCTNRGEELFCIQKDDYGRTFVPFMQKFNYENLEEDLNKVSHHSISMEKEVEHESGRWYLVQLHPFNSVDELNDGIVVNLIDITDLKMRECTLLEEKNYSEMLLEVIHEGVLILDQDLRIQMASKFYYQSFYTTPEETVGKMLFDVNNKQWDIPELRIVFNNVLQDGNKIRNYEIKHNFKEFGYRVMIFNISRVSAKQLIIVAIEDITGYKTAIEQIKELNNTLEGKIEERTSKLRSLAAKLTMSEQEERKRISEILHEDLQQILVAIQMKLNLVQWDYEKGKTKNFLKQIKVLREYTDSAIHKTRNLTSDLSPEITKSKNIKDLLEWLVAWFEHRHNLNITLNTENGLLIPDKEIRLTLVHIIRELLFNIVKHAETDQAVIDVSRKDIYGIKLAVIDKGRGFDVEKVVSHTDIAKKIGLFNVQERLNYLGGDFEIASAPGKGTRVIITLKRALTH